LSNFKDIYRNLFEDLNDRTVYSGIVSYGLFDEKDVELLISDTNYDRVKEAVLNFIFPVPERNYGWIATYKNGKKIDTEELRG
jgi:hypothetical protein